MADNEILTISVSGIKEVKAKLSKLGPEARARVADDASEFILDKLRKYPKQKRVSRLSAYGRSFFSDKQRKFFFASLRSGKINIPYSRTQEFKLGWKKVTGHTGAALVQNNVPYGKYLMDDYSQSRMSKAIGWQTLGQFTKAENESIARRVSSGDTLFKRVENAIRSVIKKLGL
jgi:hypothetical protein